MAGVGLGTRVTVELERTVAVGGGSSVGEALGTGVILVVGVTTDGACVPHPGAPQAAKKAHNGTRI